MCGLVASVLGVTLSFSAVEKDPDPDFSFDDTIKVGPFHAAPFLKIKNFGRKSLNEVKQSLEPFGLHFNMSISEDDVKRC